MNTSIMAPRVPASKSVVERENRRIVTRHQTLVDEVDALINEVINDPETHDLWVKHSDPAFDDESTEGSVDIDKIRLADMVKAHASDNAVRYPLAYAAHTKRVSQAIQSALRRTGESISQRRDRVAS